MEFNSLRDDLINGIANDDAIRIWCETTYGNIHTVYTNLDERDPPGETNCPFVVVVPIRKYVGAQVGVKEHEFGIMCGIYDSTSRIRAESNIVEFEGVQNIEIFRKKVEDVIAAVDIGNAVIATLEVEYETIESFPYILSRMYLAIKKEILIGEDPLL